MAIIHCPACDRRVSSRAGACPHCNEALAELSDSERERLLIRRWRDRIYRARNFTYLAMALVVAGTITWWLSEPQGLMLPIGIAPGVLLTVGVTGYVVAWGWLLWLKLQRDPRKP
jgi:hypothetical protein